MLVQNALHLLDLVRVLRQLAELTIAKTQLRVKQLQFQLEELKLVDGGDRLVQVGPQVGLEASA